MPLLDAMRERGFAPETAVLDRGYDTTAIYDECEAQDIRPIIPLRQTPSVVRIDAAVPRYDALRQAHSVARKLGYPGEHPDGYAWFAEVRNMEVVWPEITGLLAVDPSITPWPRTGTRDRLAWLFGRGGELWLPTAEEQEQRWAEVFAERINRARTNRANLDAYRALGEGAKGVAPAAEGPVAARLFPQHVEATGGAVTE